jgi:hypothetical protein
MVRRVVLIFFDATLTYAAAATLLAVNNVPDFA